MHALGPIVTVDNIRIAGCPQSSHKAHALTSPDDAPPTYSGCYLPCGDRPRHCDEPMARRSTAVKTWLSRAQYASAIRKHSDTLLITINRHPFVLLVTMGKEAYDDYKRNLCDCEANVLHPIFLHTCQQPRPAREEPAGTGRPHPLRTSDSSGTASSAPTSWMARLIGSCVSLYQRRKSCPSTTNSSTLTPRSMVCPSKLIAHPLFAHTLPFLQRMRPAKRSIHLLAHL